jgi:hypothetical protein
VQKLLLDQAWKPLKSTVEWIHEQLDNGCDLRTSSFSITHKSDMRFLAHDFNDMQRLIHKYGNLFVPSGSTDVAKPLH